MAKICQLHADLHYFLCMEPVDMRKQRVNDSFAYDTSKLSAVGSYEVHVPQALIKQTFDDLITILKSHFA